MRSRRSRDSGDAAHAMRDQREVALEELLEPAVPGAEARERLLAASPTTSSSGTARIRAISRPARVPVSAEISSPGR